MNQTFENVIEDLSKSAPSMSTMPDATVSESIIYDTGKLIQRM